MSNNLAFITSINAAKLRLLSELSQRNEKSFIFDAMKYHHKTYKTCKTSMKMTIKEAQAAVDEWIKTYGVRYFNELTNMALLTEEVGELARIIAIFRFLIPKAYIRLAAGRNYLEDTGIACFQGGCNASITGDMVTVRGVSIEQDLKNIEAIGYHLGA
jgi:NTP pyrophosphatase (non-canonical NTP hydrolase)